MLLLIGIVPLLDDRVRLSLLTGMAGASLLTPVTMFIREPLCFFLLLHFQLPDQIFMVGLFLRVL